MLLLINTPQSSAIEWVAFDDVTDELHVSWDGNEAYTFENVSVSVFEDMMNVQSIGNYANNLKKQNGNSNSQSNKPKITKLDLLSRSIKGMSREFGMGDHGSVWGGSFSSTVKIMIQKGLIDSPPVEGAIKPESVKKWLKKMEREEKPSFAF